MMQAKALYRRIEHEDGRIGHVVDHDGGGFVVSSERVGVAVQNFLNNATVEDIGVLHRHLLYAFKDAWNEMSELPDDGLHSVRML